jgi:SSS family solute:Na+ symporter
MYTIDWIIVICFTVFLAIIGLRMLKYTRSVADFLAANRCANRYVLGLSESAAGTGAISIIAAFEMYYAAGFSIAWWGFVLIVVQIVAALSGWILYRFRETRAMTVAQFLEIRYSRNFRVFSGLLAFFAGIVNFGIFPAVSARFFIYFCGLPEHLSILGVDLPTFGLLIAVLISFAAFFTFMGLISVMVTDFLQGIFVSLIVLVIAGYLLVTFRWSQIIESLSQSPADASMLNPFHAGRTKDFNIWFYLIQAFGFFYTLMAWQGSHAYNAAAISAHETRMARILQQSRMFIQTSLLVILPIAAYTFMHHHDFSKAAQTVSAGLANIGDSTIRTQMTVPLALSRMLPTGLLGCMCAIMLSAFITNHNTYLLSWSSIFIQDVVLPFRKKPFTPKQHLMLLRLSILGVAVFIFLFSFLFRQTSYIYMFFALTGAIFLGGAGSVIIGGLYWKRGTTLAAYFSLITGSVLAVSGIILEQMWPSYHGGNGFPINGQWMWFIAMISSIAVYVIISLFGKSIEFDLDRMLHRGQYVVADGAARNFNRLKGIKALIGVTSEFTLRDKITYYFGLGCTLLWAGTFVVGTVWNVLFDVDDSVWAHFWEYYIWSTFVLCVIITIWISAGGLKEMPDLFRRLDSVKRNEADDGSVLSHQNQDEIGAGSEQKQLSNITG